MKTNLKKIATETQELVLAGLEERSASLCKIPGWGQDIRKVLDTPLETLTEYLGDTGKKLKSFADRVNLQHPDLELFFDSIPHSKDVYAAAVNLINYRTKGELTPELNVAVDYLQQPKPRILKSAEEREKFRAIKAGARTINFKPLDEDAFYAYPEHFKRYARNSKYYKEEINQFQEKQIVFQTKNMPEMASSYNKRIKDLETSITDTCGFFRLHPEDAAIILAKLHAFPNSPGKVINIYSNYFSKPFWADDFVGVDDGPIGELKRSLILQTKYIPFKSQSATNFLYSPRMYPLSHFPLKLGEKTRVIIEKAETLTIMGNNPFFDYYWVIVPGVEVNHNYLRHGEDWIIRTSKEIKACKTQEEAELTLDTHLVESGEVVACILGEREGKCYYLCMV